jgi:hypothetical protein
MIDYVYKLLIIKIKFTSVKIHSNNFYKYSYNKFFIKIKSKRILSYRKMKFYLNLLNKKI